MIPRQEIGDVFVFNVAADKNKCLLALSYRIADVELKIQIATRGFYI